MSILKKLFLPVLILFFIAACSSDKAALKDSGISEAEEALIQANEKINNKDYEAAKVLLEKVKTTDTTMKFATLAQIRLADIYFEQELFDEASIEYENFLSMHPYNKYAPYAQFQLAMSFYKQMTTVDVSYSLALRALKEFRILQESYPRNPYMDVTETRIAKCLSILAEHELYVGMFYFNKEAYASAASRFNELLEKYPDLKKEADVYYYLGLSYKNLGEKEKALKAFTTLIEKFPATALAKEAEDIIAKIK
ncbi:MAG: outer membrane protein assembly factor BamD [Thermodesulfovibrionia bacterium]|nr:outer membrane protein assembly factor BamD [Thermodesulfovibrionia bacterium]